MIIIMESIYKALFLIDLAQSALTFIITLKDQESHPHVILSQLPMNKNNVNNNTLKKHTARLPVTPSETGLLTIPFTV